jgi:hypothetical protein
MAIKIPAPEALENINRYAKSSSTHSLGCADPPHIWEGHSPLTSLLSAALKQYIVNTGI